MPTQQCSILTIQNLNKIFRELLSKIVRLMLGRIVILMKETKTNTTTKPKTTTCISAPRPTQCTLTPSFVRIFTASNTRLRILCEMIMKRRLVMDLAKESSQTSTLIMWTYSTLREMTILSLLSHDSTMMTMSTKHWLDSSIIKATKLSK